MVGAFLCPMAAGTQAAHEGWRWSYYSLAICLSILSVMFLVAFEETKYIPVTLGQADVIDDASTERPESKDTIDEKTKMERVISVATQIDSSIPMNTWRQRLRFLTTTSESLPKLFMMPLHVITLPHVMFTALQFASGVCWLVVFMQVTSIVFSAPPYLFTTAGVGYMALGPFVGNVFGSIYGGPFADWTIVRLARRNGGLFEPEMRLYPLAITTVFMAGGIIMFGVTADRVSQPLGNASDSLANTFRACIGFIPPSAEPSSLLDSVQMATSPLLSSSTHTANSQPKPSSELPLCATPSQSLSPSPLFPG